MFASTGPGHPEHVTTERLEQLLAETFRANERVSRDEIRRRAAAAELPPVLMTRVNALPDGEYAEDEVREALSQLAGSVDRPPVPGATVWLYGGPLDGAEHRLAVDTDGLPPAMVELRHESGGIWRVEYARGAQTETGWRYTSTGRAHRAGGG